MKNKIFYSKALSTIKKTKLIFNRNYPTIILHSLLQIKFK